MWMRREVYYRGADNTVSELSSVIYEIYFMNNSIVIHQQIMCHLAILFSTRGYDLHFRIRKEYDL